MLPEVRIKKILYATDLSEYARKAFAYAVSLAKHYDASITILHTVIESPNIYSGVLNYVSKQQWKEIKAKHVKSARDILIGKKREDIPIKEALALFCEDVKTKGETQSFVTDEIVVRIGNPVDEIIKQSEERDCDIIVMGSQGHSGIVEAMVGSVSEKVMKRSKKPVLLVRLAE